MQKNPLFRESTLSYNDYRPHSQERKRQCLIIKSNKRPFPNLCKMINGQLELLSHM